MQRGPQKGRNLSAILKPEHENKWVAIDLSYSHVLAAAESLRDLIDQVGERGAVYYRVLPREATFAPTIH
jgi:hypothetical protein